MSVPNPHIIRSEFHQIYLELKERDEPQPGRMIRRFGFYVNGQLYQHHRLNYQWVGLYDNLDQYSFESEDGAYIFLPVEGTALYDVQANQLHFYAAAIDSTSNQFIGNCFSEGRLVITQSRGIQIIDLSSLQVQNILFPLNTVQLLSAHYIDDLLIVRYKDLSDYEEKTKRYDFSKMRFE